MVFFVLRFLLVSERCVSDKLTGYDRSVILVYPAKVRFFFELRKYFKKYFQARGNIQKFTPISTTGKRK
jgi:hypothetical protein